jgi:nucleotide-binding universal stress UspA family protein
MASHGRRGIARILLGSQATRVLAYSQVPVLICK